MPELPEVEITRRGIEPLIINKSISRVLVHNPSLRWPIPAELKRVLQKQKITTVSRRSKYLLASCDKGTLIIHLGMTGHLRCTSDAVASPRRKHDHLEIVFADGSALRYNDPRRFGTVLWTDADPLCHPLLRQLGPEPFSDQFTPEYLYGLSRQRKISIKAFIMDAHVVVGVGNIYASEALFRAGISPKRAAGRVSKASYSRLIEAIVDVLSESIAAGGTTIRDFSDSQGNPGFFKQELSVYGRAGQGCRVCGEKIRQVRLAQRSTFFCPHCQK